MPLKQVPFGKVFGLWDPAEQSHDMIELPRNRPSTASVASILAVASQSDFALRATAGQQRAHERTRIRKDGSPKLSRIRQRSSLRRVSVDGGGLDGGLRHPADDG